MGFKERVKEKRVEARLSQTELAEKLGVSVRTIQSYEKGSCVPRTADRLQKLAEILSTSAEHLIGSDGLYVLEAQQRGGSKAALDVESLVAEVTGLFAGGSLDEDAMDGVMRALTDAYWKAKEKNKKYAPKKYQKEE